MDIKIISLSFSYYFLVLTIQLFSSTNAQWGERDDSSSDDDDNRWGRVAGNVWNRAVENRRDRLENRWERQEDRLENLWDRREDRRDRFEDRWDDRRDRLDDRWDNREDRRENRRDRFEERLDNNGWGQRRWDRDDDDDRRRRGSNNVWRRDDDRSDDDDDRRWMRNPWQRQQQQNRGFNNVWQNRSPVAPTVPVNNNQWRYQGFANNNGLSSNGGGGWTPSPINGLQFLGGTAQTRATHVQPVSRAPVLVNNLNRVPVNNQAVPFTNNRNQAAPDIRQQQWPVNNMFPAFTAPTLPTNVQPVNRAPVPVNNLNRSPVNNQAASFANNRNQASAAPTRSPQQWPVNNQNANNNWTRQPQRGFNNNNNNWNSRNTGQTSASGWNQPMDPLLTMWAMNEMDLF
ncbi:hypothetical protein DPMN_101129 [Dreissena polymorpha]|uniref:Uncharacterized protein n=1 Tax=Dreissena polymorpha TaxID=45954 RepID=A0A9D4LIR0_DREPO|nr:hypothetical protein DPMN_101129 [Dreissena polymorpha]